MGTRCNIIIKIPAWTEQLTYNLPSGEKATREHEEDLLWVYRHWDGYPEETGADLLCLADILLTQDPRSIRESKDVFKILQSMSIARDLNYMLKSKFTIPYSLGKYEITTGQHGDIEWLYTVTLSPPQAEERTIHIRFDEIHWKSKARMYYAEHGYSNCSPRFPNQITTYIAGGTDEDTMYKTEASRKQLSSLTEGGQQQ